MPDSRDIQAALDARPALLRDACQRALRYLAGLADRPVAPPTEAVSALSRFGTALPERGTDPAEVLAALDETGSPATVATGGPRYFGFVNGGTLPVALACAWLSTAWDQNAALTVMSPVASALDAVALRWVTELLGLPAGTGGGFVTGATARGLTGGRGLPRRHYGVGMAVKLAIVVRTDLGMGRGKIAAQVAHAAVAAVLGRLGDPDLATWLAQGQSKVVLKVPTGEDLDRIVERARAAGLPAELVHDAGRTQLTPGTLTCCALGPAESRRIDAVTAGLSLL